MKRLRTFALALGALAALASPAAAQQTTNNILIQIRNALTALSSPSIGGFTPNGETATLSVSDASDRVALPTGTVDVIWNVGTSTAYIKLGDDTVDATAGSDIPVQAGHWFAVTVDTAAYVAGVADTSETASLIVAGGSGLPTGAGGGGGDGSTDVSALALESTQADVKTAVEALAAIVSGGALNITGNASIIGGGAVTTGTGAIDSSTPRVALATDSPGVTPTVTPLEPLDESTATIPVRSACNNYAFYTGSSADTQTLQVGGADLQAGASQKVFICGYHWSAADTTTLTLKQGSDDNCATNTAAINPPFAVPSGGGSDGMTFGNGYGPRTTADNYFVCITSSAAKAHSVEITYALLND